MKGRIVIWNCILLVMTIGVLGGVARADQIVMGTVVDSSGAVVPNAMVMLTNRGTGVQTALKTDGAGLYRGVPIHSYKAPNRFPISPSSYFVIADLADFTK